MSDGTFGTTNRRNCDQCKHEVGRRFDLNTNGQPYLCKECWEGNLDKWAQGIKESFNRCKCGHDEKDHNDGVCHAPYCERRAEGRCKGFVAQKNEAADPKCPTCGKTFSELVNGKFPKHGDIKPNAAGAYRDSKPCAGSGKSPSKNEGSNSYIDLGNGYFANKVGMDSNGNHSVWVSKGSNASKKIQTNANAPSAHRVNSLDDLSNHPEAQKELVDYYKKYMESTTKEKSMKTKPVSEAFHKVANTAIEMMVRLKESPRSGRATPLLARLDGVANKSADMVAAIMMGEHFTPEQLAAGYKVLVTEIKKVTKDSEKVVGEGWLMFPALGVGNDFNMGSDGGALPVDTGVDPLPDMATAMPQSGAGTASEQVQKFTNALLQEEDAYDECEKCGESDFKDGKCQKCGTKA